MSEKKKKPSKETTTTTANTTTKTVVTTTTTVNKSLDTHYLLILDRSGSMTSCWNSTIEGLNEQIGSIRGLDEEYPEQRYFITLVVFDGKIETILDDVPVSEVKNFTGKEFPPRGFTALHDAMGFSIKNLKEKLDKKDDDSNSISTALVVVMTDGHENCSSEYKAESIKKLIDELNETGAWTISYMGANQDAVLTASQFGIYAANSVTYSSTSAGADAAYKTLTRAVISKAKMSNLAFNASASLGDITFDSLDLKNNDFFSSVVDGDVIGEDLSNVSKNSDKA